MTCLRAIGFWILTLPLSACATGPQSDEPRLPPSEVAAMQLAMADALVKQQDYDKALPYLQDLRQRRPGEARVHLLLGIVLREKGMHAPARAELDQAVRLSPRDPETHSALAVLLDKEGEHKEAEVLHRKALSMNNKDPRLHNNLGFCLFLQKRFRDALDQVKEAIRLDPGLRRAYNNLGFIYGMMGQLENALEAFNQAGGQAMALTNMGLVQEMRGRPVSARYYYEKALRHDRGYRPALHNLHALQPQIRPDSDETMARDPDPLPDAETDAAPEVPARDPDDTNPDDTKPSAAPDPSRAADDTTGDSPRKEAP